jgi:hypothetical protein
MKKVNIVGIAAVQVYNKDQQEFNNLEYHATVGSAEKVDNDSPWSYKIDDRFVLKSEDFPKFSKQFRRHKISVILPSNSIFPRFVKLPPVSPDKLKQIVQYEAEQNVPFPIAEVAWGYAIRKGDSGELNCILSAAKGENIEATFNGLNIDAVFTSHDAVARLYQKRIQDKGGNIGIVVTDAPAPTTTIIIADSYGFKFARSIPIPAYFEKGVDPAIFKTRSYASQLDIESENIETVLEKVNRNVGVRLNAEMNRTRNFIRSQQGYDFDALWTPDKRLVTALPEIAHCALEEKDPYAEIANHSPAMYSESNGAMLSAAALVSYPDGLRLQYEPNRPSAFRTYVANPAGEMIQIVGSIIASPGRLIESLGKSMQKK